MRLRVDHLQKIIEALTPFLQGSDTILYLFGSRTQDYLKGGDLDLALVMNDQKLFHSLSKEKHRLMSALHKFLGDRKIDLKLGLAHEIRNDLFFQRIMESAIELYCWKLASNPDQQ